MAEALCIAIVGAESTGKSTLAAALAQHLAAQTGQRVAWVPEWLRSWCEHALRTPLAHEQASILRTQHEHIEAAAATHDIVVCDTTALMTAVYSGLVFGDPSLDERALQLHTRRVAVTLLTALDLPWVSDGLQRDGPQVREPVDNALRALMQQGGISYAVVSGVGDTRVQHAMAAVQPGLGRARHKPAGLLTGLGAAPRKSTAWSCECCLPDQERALRNLQNAAQSDGSAVKTTARQP